MNQAAFKKIVLAAAAVTLPAVSLGANKVWNAGQGSWSTAASWSPTGVPGLVDFVSIGSSQAANGQTVFLDVNTTINGLTITDDMDLDINSRQLTVMGDTTISGGTTTRMYMDHNFFNDYDFRTTNLNLLAGGDLILDKTVVNVLGTATVDFDSGIYGAGVINFYGNNGPVLVANGNVAPGTFGSGPVFNMTLNQLGSGRIDLDGTVGDDHAVYITGGEKTFTINGDQLHDAFDDSMFIGTGSRANMNLTDGWTLGTTGWLAFTWLGNAAQATLDGGTLTCNGTITFVNNGGMIGETYAPLVINTGTVLVQEYKKLHAYEPVTVNTGRILVDGHAEFDGPFVMNAGTLHLGALAADATFNHAATFNGGRVIANDLTDAVFYGATTINAGTFTADFRGEIEFNGNTKVFGGHFTADESQGGIRFNGPTEYKNTVTMVGPIHQNGTATVNNTATINADIFDMDGETALTNWNINAPLTLNANQINTGNNTFTGKLTLTSSTSSPAKLAVNLPAGTSWNMSGAMFMIGHGFGTTTDVISGSDVTISGQATVSFENAISARATFSHFNVTTINTASGLRLDGGTLLNPNRIEGATIKGTGSLRSIANRALTGYGTISSAIAFAGGELRADGGVLNVNGPVTSVGIIAAEQGSTLKFGVPFNTSTSTRLEVNGGVVTGSSVTNASGKEIRGKGFITTAGLNNSGTLSAIGGTLAIDTTSAPDLDGSSETGRLSIAANSELYFADTPADEFNGNASIAAGGLLRFEQSFTQGNLSTMNLNGTVAQPANVSAVTMNLKGNISMPSNAQGTFNAKTTFENGVSAFINPGAQLEIIQDSNINAGANFTGGGTLKNGPGVKMLLAHDAEVGVKILNTGSFEVNALFPAAASAGGFEQTSIGSTRFDVFGATPGTLHDKLTVTGAANLNGTLTLNRGLGNPAYLQSHEIISAAGGVNGTFSKIGAIEISPTKYWAVTYDADSVLATPALPGDANLDGGVNIADFALLASNFNTTGTWADGSFDGNTTVNISDFALLAGNFNQSVPADLPRGTAVPEPVLGVALLPLLARRRRNR